MTRCSMLLPVLFALACGDRTPPPETAQQTAPDSLDEVPVEEEVPPMPDYPDNASGRLTIRAVGALELEHGWSARAGRCVRPALVLVLAEEPGSGASVLLHLPTSGELIGTYPVGLADSTGIPAAPASQLGFQFFEANTADAYQGSAGAVEVRELTDRRVSGRFQVTMRHVVSNRTAQVAGTFQHVDLEPLPPDWCDRAAAAQDSLSLADSTAGGS